MYHHFLVMSCDTCEQPTMAILPIKSLARAASLNWKVCCTHYTVPAVLSNNKAWLQCCSDADPTLPDELMLILC